VDAGLGETVAGAEGESLEPEPEPEGAEATGAAPAEAPALLSVDEAAGVVEPPSPSDLPASDLPGLDLP
jgi:hypothetical protein